MPPAIDLTGQRFGRLVVLELAGHYGPNREKLWRCRCDCGNTITTYMGSLRRGLARSCGCLQREAVAATGFANTKHGERTRSEPPTREYVAWIGMKGRCYNPQNPKFPSYGGRGIRVNRKWLHSFETFLEDMGRCPPGFSLNRVNNDGPYSKGNCEWASAKVQANNRRPRIPKIRAPR